MQHCAELKSVCRLLRFIKLRPRVQTTRNNTFASKGSTPNPSNCIWFQRWASSQVDDEWNFWADEEIGSEQAAPSVCACLRLCDDLQLLSGRSWDLLLLLLLPCIIFRQRKTKRRKKSWHRRQIGEGGEMQIEIPQTQSAPFPLSCPSDRPMSWKWSINHRWTVGLG